MPSVAPLSTYRLQFNKDFPFEKARALADYWRDLGIGAAYASPITVARAGSLHGYDVIDPTRINPELGSIGDFAQFAETLKKHGLGLIVDVVPNHMCISGAINPWWHDVLENGPASPYAKYFDILWRPPKASLANKILFPVLGEQYGRMIENGEIRIGYDMGLIFAEVYNMRLPISPRTWTIVLEPALASIKTADTAPADVEEFESILTALRHLPDRTDLDAEHIKERTREKEVIRKRLESLVDKNGDIKNSLKKALEKLNGAKGDPRSFDALESLLNEQGYRLCFWRVAADEINYRRFFDIWDLAAIRVEDPDVFETVHRLLLELIAKGWITGLRIDHVDGLYDPQQYLSDLRKSISATDPFFVVVEKILTGDERLRRGWETDGTTGYDAINLLTGVFIDQRPASRFRDLYARFTGKQETFADVQTASKRSILLNTLASELRVLAIQLEKISEQHRWSSDFTFESLRFSLREVIVAFPVYRSYVRPGDDAVSADDKRVIQKAVGRAKRANPTMNRSVFDFIESVLLLEHPPGLSDEQTSERRRFVLKLQQLTSPVMAKGTEDTAFYRYFPLASLNEVGGEPGKFGATLKEFHKANDERAKHEPRSLVATTTHDTKRSEDVRARINVLSEIPILWYRSIKKWQLMNRSKKILLDETIAPDTNDEYLLYQTLIGCWPFDDPAGAPRAAFVDRIVAYMIKAAKEAKIHTSWINPNETYEAALEQFVRSVLDDRNHNAFLNDFRAFERSMRRFGLLTALSQTALKLTIPGIPDFYQGTEAWCLSLVDPDNRRPVDYQTHRQALYSLPPAGSADRPAFLADLLNRLEDDRVKIFVTREGLALRNRNRELFLNGSYIPLHISGRWKNEVVAFARTLNGHSTVTVAARFFTHFDFQQRPWIDPPQWENTVATMKSGIPAGRYRDAISGQTFMLGTKERTWAMTDILRYFPIALLERWP